MTKTLHAIYEHGILRPLEPIEGIRENSEVEVTIAVKQKEVFSYHKICWYIK